MTQRNAAAHETRGDFAQLLLSDFNNTHVLELWKEILPVLYGASVQEIATREGPAISELLALSCYGPTRSVTS